MGARGRNVVLDQENGTPAVVNDGVTIAREISFEDRLQNSAVSLIKDAANVTNDAAGDGTTTSTVLARSIVKQGWKMVDNGANPVLLRKEIEAAAKTIDERLKEAAEEITAQEKAIQIATVSVQDKDLGKQIGELMYEVGVNGAVSIKDSLKTGVFFERDGGMRIEGALKGGLVDNQDKWETKLKDPKVLILKDSPEDHEFESKWLPLLQQFTEGQRQPNGQMQITKVNVPCLLVVAEKLSRRFIMMLNQNSHIIKWCWFRPTTANKNMNEIYKDFQSMTGGDIVEEEAGVFLSNFSLSQLGQCETATLTRHELVITVNDQRLKSGEFLDRCNDVKGQIDNAEDEIEQEQIKERYANLTGGVAVVKVAAVTEKATLELKLRIEDAINATRSAMEEGIVDGGGVAIYSASRNCGDSDGAKALEKACEAPIRQILENAGHENIDNLLSRLKPGEGVDVLENKTVNMKKQGIIDALKVVRLSLVNAVSVAGLLLTSEFVVTNEKDKLEDFKGFLK